MRNCSEGSPVAEDCCLTTGEELPPHLIRELAPPRPHRDDPDSRYLAQLLRLHPEIDRGHAGLDLTTATPALIRETLARIRRQLSIPVVPHDR